MASNNTKKQVHVSPGIYFSESELPVAVRSLGITNLGVAGETLRGPAFQVIDVANWAQYKSFFGGTSTEKYKGSQFPKYELPYIAKTYLEQSQNLKVCRVLGLSGVNAGKAWVITAYHTDAEDPKVNSVYTSNSPMVVAILRSRGEHQKAVFQRYADGENDCNDVYAYDEILYYAKNVKLKRSSKLNYSDGCKGTVESEYNSLTINPNNYGRFALEVETSEKDASGNPIKKTYSVSFNPEDKNYIYNVLGGDPEDGDAEIFVEELYDVALKQLIETGKLNTLGNDELTKDGNAIDLPYYQIARIVPNHEPVTDLLTFDESMLRRKDTGKRYLYSAEFSKDEEGNALQVHTSSDNGVSWSERTAGQAGHIYTVYAHTLEDGSRTYYYGEIVGSEEELKVITATDEVEDYEDVVYVNADGMYYILRDNDVKPITLDLNNYKEAYRYSSTPWIVSEIKGSVNNVELTKLFRFHTISDGSTSASEIKISIENINPTTGTFDVLVRDFSDTDVSPIVLERYKSVDLVPGSENYIALAIGSFDEAYETKSKYITVEVNETDKTRISVPAGFLGYPIRNYGGTAIGEHLNDLKLQKPYLLYNLNVDEEIRIKRQYFGMSDLVGIDTDLLKYKGVEAYNDLPEGLTSGFHLDSRIFNGTPGEDGTIEQGGITQKVMVDGVTGYSWATVGMYNTVGNFGEEPRLGTEEEMFNTIYEDIRYRKFTLCFYGGWDGWDYYRTSRSNTDDFKYQKYRGHINPISGEGRSLSVLKDPELYNFDKSEKCLNSDYYAYLYAIRQFANPKENDINVFATPGIDYVNNNLLVGETIEMIEEERADSIYVITTPDKPFGAGDGKTEMYTAEEAVDNLIDSDVDTNWGCTYFPWIKYYDADNNQYIYLPPTKDVVKNFAYTDNVAAPWYAAAGWNRGLTDGIKSKKNLVISEQDELYGGRINFVNNFADEGMRIWGDNNLQVAPSKAHMNKISKRRCLIRLRKLISIACIGLVFDPNDNTTISSFRSAVEPILEDFVSKRALIDAKLVIDESEESLDKLELNAQIYLQFQPNLEYINIGLVATPQGVSFDDI